MNLNKKTYAAKPADVDAQRRWWVVDAANQPLGRLASVVATKLRGKDKPIFTPHADTGDFVVVVNADKVKLTGNKARDTKYYSHSGYAGGLRTISHEEMMRSKPTFPIEKAVRGMLPKNVLGRKLLKKLKVYTGPDHPHTAQAPTPLELKI